MGRFYNNINNTKDQGFLSIEKTVNWR